MSDSSRPQGPGAECPDGTEAAEFFSDSERAELERACRSLLRQSGARVPRRVRPGRVPANLVGERQRRCAVPGAGRVQNEEVRTGRPVAKQEVPKGSDFHCNLRVETGGPLIEVVNNNASPTRMPSS